MSERDVESLRRGIAAYNARDIEGLISICDPEIEFHSAFAAVDGVDYHGHAGLRQWNQDVADAWGEDVRVEPEEFFDHGEHVLAFYVLHGRGLGSGVEVAMPVALVTRWRDGRIVYLRGYAHREDALADLGVSGS